METSDLRKEIKKCLEQSYHYGNIIHAKQYDNDIKTLDNMMVAYFGMCYNEETEKYE